MSSIVAASSVLPVSEKSVRGTSPAAWPAIIAGAFVSAGTSLIMLALGSGLGFAEVSPWANRGVSAATFTVTMAIWLIATQWVSAFLGGYIAGRLRTTWTGTHTHEVFFRDTANGLVMWAVSTIFITAVVASSAVSAFGVGVHSAANVASGAGSAYGIDRLFRQAPSATGTATSAATGTATSAAAPSSSADSRAEAARILANATLAGSMPDADRTYLSQLVAVRTGVAPEEAQKRVDELMSDALSAEAKIKEEADRARETAAEAAIYTALSLLIGAFIASVAAAVGGRLRDEHP